MKGKTIEGRYVPDSEDLECIENKDANALVYVGTINGKPFAYGFTGKSLKPKFRYAFRTEESRTDYINKWFDNLTANRKSQAEARAKASEEADEFAKQIKIGDIFHCGWGYSMTLNDFYKVVGKSPSGKSIKVRKLAKKHVESDGGWSGREVPIDDLFASDNITTHRVLDGHIKMSSYSWARLWDGESKYYNHLD